jgi:acyl-CoA synthetase (AMP-forming)/AMP-acid ligase II
MAAALADAGIRGGDRVLIVNENSAATAAALFAASQLNAWAVLVNARLAPIEIDRICQHAQPRAIAFTHAVSQDAAAHADRYHAGVSVMTVAGPIRIVAGLPATPEPVATSNASQVAAVIYIGNHRQPKGVMLTHRNPLLNALSSRAVCRIGSSDFVIQLVRSHTCSA